MSFARIFTARRAPTARAGRARGVARLGVAAGLATTLILGAAACGSDSHTPTQPTPPPTFVGTYTLLSVGSDTVPAVVDTTGGATTEFVDGTIVFNADSTYVAHFDTRKTFTASGQVVNGVAGSTGTWSARGSTVTIDVTGGGVINATDDGVTLSFIDPQAQTRFVFKKTG